MSREHLHLEVTGLRQSGMRPPDDPSQRVILVEVMVSESQVDQLGLEGLGDTLCVNIPDHSYLVES